MTTNMIAGINAAVTTTAMTDAAITDVAAKRHDEFAMAPSGSRARTLGTNGLGTTVRPAATRSLGGTGLGDATQGRFGTQDRLHVLEPTGDPADAGLVADTSATSGPAPSYVPSMSILQPRDHVLVGQQ